MNALLTWLYDLKHHQLELLEAEREFSLNRTSQTRARVHQVRTALRLTKERKPRR